MNFEVFEEQFEKVFGGSEEVNESSNRKDSDARLRARASMELEGFFEKNPENVCEQELSKRAAAIKKYM